MSNADTIIIRGEFTVTFDGVFMSIDHGKFHLSAHLNEWHLLMLKEF